MSFKPFKPFKRECNHIEPLLWEYAGERLSEPLMVQVKTHLNACHACQTQLQAIQRIEQGLETLRACPVPPTHADWADVRARINNSQPAPQNFRRAAPMWGHRLLAGGSVVAAAALAWLVVVPRGASENAANTAKNAEARNLGLKNERLAVANMKATKHAEDGLEFEAASGTVNSNMEKLAASVKLPVFKAMDFFSATQPLPPSLKAANPQAFDSSDSLKREVETNKIRLGQRRRYHRHAAASIAASSRTKMPRRRTIVNAPVVNPTVAASSGTMMPVLLRTSAPNYVLSSAQVEEPQRTPRAYVMDCVTLDANNPPSNSGDGNGEDTRVW